MTKDEEARLLREMLEGSSDEDSDEIDETSNGQEEEDNSADPKKKDGSEGSIESDDALFNKSLNSNEDDEAVDPINYLRYASEKENKNQDLIDIVDKNERSFKQVAEKMIEQSSQLVEKNVEQPAEEEQRKLMSASVFDKIANRFHGDINFAQGVPYCIAALEDFIAIGSSDGSVRLFDSTEKEIRFLFDKGLKGNAVTCMDVMRIGVERNIFVVTGHTKGQVALYEIKGLSQRMESRDEFKESLT